MPRSTRPPPIRSTAEFARYVGLARTTVSRVLNGHPGLKPKTIERVRRAMVETGFSRNAFALHLKGQRTASVGICMESLLRVPAVLKLATLQRRLRERNYTSLIEVLDPAGTSSAVASFLSMRVEAVAFIGYFAEAELTDRIAELSRLGVPHILIDHAGIPGAHSVSLDRRQAMEDLTRHLIGLGHTSFGLLGISEEAKSTWDRLQGIGDALAAHGMTLERNTVSFDHLHPREYNYEFGRALAKSFASIPHRPTAFMSLNDEIGAGAVRGFKESGLAVPDDVSVTGFNNQDLGLVSTPQLTSVDQQIIQTIDAAVKMLFAQISQPERSPPAVELIKPQIILRESTGPAKRAGN
ncbi:MAG: LacI family DNA-binding transcriptional regulator [Opitutales bacterium]